MLVWISGNSSWSIGAPGVSSCSNPGNGGEVGPGRVANVASSPNQRAANARRRVVVPPCCVKGSHMKYENITWLHFHDLILFLCESFGYFW